PHPHVIPLHSHHILPPYPQVLTTPSSSPPHPHKFARRQHYSPHITTCSRDANIIRPKHPQVRATTIASTLLKLPIFKIPIIFLIKFKISANNFINSLINSVNYLDAHLTPCSYDKRSLSKLSKEECVT